MHRATEGTPAGGGRSVRPSLPFSCYPSPEAVASSNYPSTKLAAVLVLLYEKAGELRVLLTTRSKSLRAHPGQVALPGGKVDATDSDVFETAVSMIMN